MKIINRPLIVLLTVSFFISILPLQSLAADQQPVTLQNAIQIAKRNFEVPSSLTEFSSRFSDYSTRPSWSLNWRSPDNGGGFSVDVDSKTGDIIAMSSYKPDDGPVPAVRIPSYTADEAAKISESFLKKIVPSYLDEVHLVSPLKQLENTNHMTNEYFIFWQRTAGNIPVQGEGALLRVDKFKGTVNSYQLKWTHTNFPTSGKAVSKSQAQKAFVDAEMFELQYLVPRQFVPMSKDQPVQPILVYSLTHKSRGLIDATSGKPLVVPSGQYLLNFEDQYGPAGYGTMKMAASEMAQVQLTPEEQEEIKKHSILLTQQEALEALFKWVPAAKDLPLRSVSLEAEYSQPQIRSWILNFVKSDPNGANSYLFARIDASSGELMSFSYDFPRDSFDPKKTLSREQCEKSARDFIKLVQPEKSRYIRIDMDNENQYALPDQSFTRYFNYTRLVNNIPVQNQGISVTVDSTTGEVVGFNLNWPDLKFPNPAGIMNNTQAISAYLNQQHLTLSYCPLSKEQVIKEMRLVYMPWCDYGVSRSMLVDARTGRLLNWIGQPLSEIPDQVAFKDLKGISGEKEINILGQLGFFREYGDSFRPDQPITLVSFLRALILARDSDNQIYDIDNDEVMKRARAYGWLTEKIAPNTILSRETAGRIIIRYLNLEHVARLQGVYIHHYKDIEDEFVGFAAILNGYNIIKGQQAHFTPTASVTRAEAAQYIFRMSNASMR